MRRIRNINDVCAAESVKRQSLASLVPLSDQPGQPPH
jgi:hypothetical protein